MSSFSSLRSLIQEPVLEAKADIDIPPDSSSEAPPLDDKLAEYGTQRSGSTSTSSSITWRRDSCDHPRNWSSTRKLYDTTVIILLEFYTTIISTTGPAAASPAAKEYSLSVPVSLVAFSFIYQLGQALGGLVMPPFSESFGRRSPYIWSSAVFAVSCVITGAVPSVAGVFIGRFIMGFASATPSVVIAGSVEDMYNSRRRVWLVLAWNAVSTSALIIGPIYGTYIEYACGWRWIYYSAAIGTAALTLLTLGIKESRPSLILSRKVEQLQKVVSEKIVFDNYDAAPTARMFLEVVLIRPSRLLVSEPIVILVATLTAIAWSIIYLFTEALTNIYISIGLSNTSASLPFLAMLIGVSLTVLPRFWDIKVANKRRRNNEPLEPEDKIRGFFIAIPALAIGMWWFAWTIPPAVPHLSWIVPTISLVFIGFAVSEIAYTLSGYLADSYTVYAASAFAALAFLRAIVSGLAPLIAYYLYNGISYNLATTVLAAIATLFLVAPVILHRYSRDLRRRSVFARHSLEVHAMTRVEDD
ncbi:MAG: hypothetical protein M1821_008186 [Bathelium mastoideum]|nr:MAG: hypothetical protein M1821_008186 [Bathelium mastoideum]KAI9693231.1 MAG: hypothetical protein M1822_005227 [Bathelium mastoideum]